MAGDCGADELANTLVTALTVGENFTVPAVDLTQPEFQIPALGELAELPAELTNADLTSGTVAGTGTFDVLMAAAKQHLQQEFDKGRITGAEYAKAYIAMIESCMGQGVAYLLGRSQAYWQAVTARYQALLAQTQVVTARVQLEVAKAQLQQLYYEALTAKANFALTKMKVSSESMAFCVAEFNLDHILPAQEKLLNEQYEVQRAQTLDTRTDGTVIVGSIGKQKALYSQQITSYQRDGEIKAAKLFTDAWTVMKTMDEGILPPTAFANTSLNEVLNNIKLNNAIGTAT